MYILSLIYIRIISSKHSVLNQLLVFPNLILTKNAVQDSKKYGKRYPNWPKLILLIDGFEHEWTTFNGYASARLRYTIAKVSALASKTRPR